MIVRGEWSGGGGGGGGGRAVFHMNGGGGQPPPPKPMLDPGLVSVYRSDLPWHIHIRKYLRGALI